jgi:hypothetical protein
VKKKLFSILFAYLTVADALFDIWKKEVNALPYHFTTMGAYLDDLENTFYSLNAAAVTTPGLVRTAERPVKEMVVRIG